MRSYNGFVTLTMEQDGWGREGKKEMRMGREAEEHDKDIKE